MKPTIEQIIADLQMTMPLTRREQVVEASKSIHALFNPVLKPLSELANDIPSCKKLMSKMARKVRFKRVQKSNSCFWIHGFCAGGIEGVEMTLVITVFHDGRGILFNNDGNVLTFRLAHFIQKLGYDVTPETK